ncbi:PHP domain-containing protein [Psychromonas sp. PT13]|uniref:PHP domain-containing protein n=1 Tax=Psychromonas sp. PT13 TaxID=3439547 RepID=UPI003EB91B3A
MKTIDLHIHTTASDGSFTPRELVDYAIEKQLSAIAMTDHDTMRGVQEAIDYIATLHSNLELIPGIEVSSFAPGSYFGFHILGYFFENNTDERTKIIRNLEIDLSRGTGSPEEAIKIISNYGGLSSLAHPLEYCLSTDELSRQVEELASVGLNGIEGIYTTHSNHDVSQFNKIASQYGLIVTGGSDFHGKRKPGVDLGTGFGDLQIPYNIIDSLKASSAVHH